MTDQEQTEVLRVIASIEKRLESLEELMYWLIKANSRFKKGQRVKFSAKACKSGVAPAKGGAIKGRVTKVTDSFSVEVLVDGYKRPRSYHHMFFDPIR